jgi:hypothetical protein
MHLLENFSLLATDLESELQPEPRELRTEFLKRLAAFADIDDHHHVEVFLDDSLGDIQDIDVILGEMGAGLCENTHSIPADDGYDGFFHGKAYYTLITPT